MSLLNEIIFFDNLDGDAEIRELYDAIRSHQKIGSFDITVNNSLVVQIGDTREDLLGIGRS